MAPLFETRGAEGADSTGLIVRLSDVRRLGAWKRVGARAGMTRGTLAVARRQAMRAAVAHVAIVRPQLIAAASELGGEISIACGALCMRATRRMSSLDPAVASIFCAAAA